MEKTNSMNSAEFNKFDGNLPIYANSVKFIWQIYLSLKINYLKKKLFSPTFFAV